MGIVITPYLGRFPTRGPVKKKKRIVDLPPGRVISAKIKTPEGNTQVPAVFGEPDLQ